MQSKQLSASVREKGQMKQLLVIFGAYNMRHLEQDYYLGFFLFFFFVWTDLAMVTLCSLNIRSPDYFNILNEQDFHQWISSWLTVQAYTWWQCQNSSGLNSDSESLWKTESAFSLACLQPQIPGIISTDQISVTCSTVVDLTNLICIWFRNMTQNILRRLLITKKEWFWMR